MKPHKFLHGFLMACFFMIIYIYPLHSNQNIVLRGIVKNETGRPVSNARIEIVAMKKLGVKRIIFSRKNGTWIAPFLPKGYWKITVFTKEWMSYPIFIHLRIGSFKSMLKLNRKSLKDLFEQTIPTELDVSIQGIHSNIGVVLVLHHGKDIFRSTLT